MSFWDLLHPHQDTGKLAAHRHTSYAGLAMLLLVLGLCLVAQGTGVSAGTLSGSGDIQVTGTIPAPPPSQAPQILQPANGAHVVTSPRLVSGSCTRDLVVAVSRNGVSAGSALCSSAGTFSLSIDLYNGRNDLSAVQYDSLFQQSPQSAVITVYFDQNSSQNPASVSRNSRSSKLPAGPTAPPPPLAIQTKFSFQGVFAGQEFGLPIAISGGVPAYAVSIDWGDRKQTLLSQAENGSHEYTHTYAEPGNYRVIIRATDANGTPGYYETVILAAGAASSGVVNGKPFDQSLGLVVAWPVYAAILLLVVGFWLGERYDANRWRHRAGNFAK